MQPVAAARPASPGPRRPPSLLPGARRRPARRGLHPAGAARPASPTTSERSVGRSRAARPMRTAWIRRGSEARRVADFRTAFLDEAAIEARGIAPVRPLLRRIEQMRDKRAADALSRQRAARRCRPDQPRRLRLGPPPGAGRRSRQPRRDGSPRLSRPGRPGPARPRALPQRRAGHAGPGAQSAGRASGRCSIASRPPTPGRPRDSAARADAVAGARDRDRAQPCHARGLGQTIETPRRCGRAPTSRVKPRASTGPRSSRPPAWRSKPSFVAWQPGALKGAAALVASQPLEVWKDYLRVRTIERYADVLPAAFSARPTGGRARRARAGGDAIGDERFDRQDVRGTPLSARAQARGYRPSSPDVVAAFARRVEAASVDDAGIEDDRARQAAQPLLRRRLSRPLAGRRRPRDRPRRCLRQRAAPRAAQLSPRDRPARPADRPPRMDHGAAVAGRRARLQREQLQLRGRPAASAEVRSRCLRRGQLRLHRRHRRPRGEPLRRRPGCRLRGRRPHAPLVDGRRPRGLRGGRPHPLARQFSAYRPFPDDRRRRPAGA